jgi:hypothetical protein
MSSTALSPLDQLAQSGQAQPSQQTQPASDLSPLDQLAQSSPTPTASPSGQANFVPNARIRNLPNPAEGLTPGQALMNGVKTGAELAAVPATAIGLGEAEPVIAHLAENLPNLDKAWKIVKIIGGTEYTLQHLKDVLKVLGGGSNNK